MKKDEKSASEMLRQKAEERLKTKLKKTALPLSEIEMLKLIHELEVHQVELELQNNELQQAKTLADIATNKYSDLYNFAPSGYFTLSLEGNIIELNLTSALMLGKERSKLINNRFSLFVSTDTRASFNLFLEKIFESTSSKTCEVKLAIEGNLPKHVLLSGMVADNERQCNVTMVNIEERKKAEEALKESEERYRLIYENTTMGLYRTTPDGRILMANPTLVKMMKFESFEQLASRNLEKEGFKQSYERKEFIECVENEGSVIGLESNWTCKDKSVIYVRESAKAIRDVNGKTLYYDGTVENITERKQAEEEIKLKNQELQQLNATKDKFFSIIAHDLKSPFNSIVGFSKLLVEKVRDEDYDSIRKYAGIIEQSSNRAMDLLTNLMEWSRSQTDRMVFNPEYIEMVSLINEIALSFDDIATQKAISIHRNLPANTAVFGDKAMISTVLRNLISNAVKFTRSGGKIIISAQNSQNEFKVSVSDNGVGISKSRLEKLFRLDENYSTSGTNNEKGTGLGLILCKEFTEKNQGNIWAESKEGKGSTFYFTVKGRA